MPRHSTYDKFPCVPVNLRSSGAQTGWRAIGGRLREVLAGKRAIVCVECYPGVSVEEIDHAPAEALRPLVVIRSAACFKTSEELGRTLDGILTDDPVFGRMSDIAIADFSDLPRMETEKRRIANASGPILVMGTGASLLAPSPNLLVYADHSCPN